MAEPAPGDRDPTLLELAVQRRLGAREQEARDQVRRLLDVTLALMSRDPGRPPRVADVVRSAGLTNQAFYRVFASRDDLLAAVVDDGSRRLVAHVERRMRDAQQPADRLRRVVEVLLHQAADPDVAATTRAVMSGTVRPGGQAGRSRVHLAERLASLLVPDLAALGADDAERDARALAHAALGTMEHFLWRSQAPAPRDVEHLSELLLSFLPTAPDACVPDRG